MRKLVVWLIKFYQKYISSMTPPCCRFSPSCSQYGIEAVERFGVIRGLAMTVWRVARCNPWTPGGYDPVPEKKENNKKFRFIDYKAVKNREKK